MGSDCFIFCSLYAFDFYSVFSMTFTKKTISTAPDYVTSHLGLYCLPMSQTKASCEFGRCRCYVIGVRSDVQCRPNITNVVFTNGVQIAFNWKVANKMPYNKKYLAFVLSEY